MEQPYGEFSADSDAPMPQGTRMEIFEKFADEELRNRKKEKTPSAWNLSTTKNRTDEVQISDRFVIDALCNLPNLIEVIPWL